MANAARQFLDSIRESKAGQVAGKIWDEMAHPVAHGAHELAAALFHGNAFVMYPRAGQGEDPKKEEPQKEVQQREPQREQERGGREM